MVTYYHASLSGHCHCCSGDVMFLMVEEQDCKCLLNSAITQGLTNPFFELYASVLEREHVCTYVVRPAGALYT